MKGEEVAGILMRTGDRFLQYLEGRDLSEDYMMGVHRIIRGFARFCRTEPESNPWEMRKEYLSRMGEIRAQQPFTNNYLICRGKLLRGFLRWHGTQNDGEIAEISEEVVDKYLSACEGIHPYKSRWLKGQVEFLKEYMNKMDDCGKRKSIDNILKEYFEKRRKHLRGGGYGMVITNRSQVVTRRLLMWLEKEGYLPAGTCFGQVEVTIISNRRECEEFMERVRMRVDSISLAEGLRMPLISYIEYQAEEKKLSKSRIMQILSTIIDLCRAVEKRGMNSFSDLGVEHIDDVVSSLMTSASADMHLRRQRVKHLHGHLRGFLQYLYENGLVRRDLSSVLISPPCYRASKPPQGLSEREVTELLASIDRGSAEGRRAYAIVMLMAAYGLRSSDIAGMNLDDIRWRDERITICQSKTQTPLTLPLLDDVARALYEYIKNDRANYVTHRYLFHSLQWPFKPLQSGGVGKIVKGAMVSAGMAKYSARHIRHSVAIRLLHQGEALSTIQDILGHRIPETTQRYAVTDPVILRRIIDMEER